MNRDNELVRQKMDKIDLPLGGNDYGKFQFFVGSVSTPALKPYLVSKFEIYKGSTIFRKSCGPAYSNCYQTAVLEDGRAFCNICDYTNPAGLIEYLDNSINFSRNCFTSADLTDENIVSQMNSYNPSKVAFRNCEPDYEDNTVPNICNADKCKFPNLNLAQP
jgi:hypothetical protein